MTEKAREAPAPTPLSCGPEDAAFPAARWEPLLEVEDIQGNILGGFNKSHQHLLFLRIEDPAQFKPWLKDQVPRIATSAEVIAYNRLYKHLRSSEAGRRTSLRTTWISIAFSHAGLEKLGAIRKEEPFRDAAFREGLAGRSASLNDPTDKKHGSPTWRIGGPGNEAHVVIIVAADSDPDLDAAVSALLKIPGGTMVFDERGHNLAGNLSGHEHFGFLDGVSQPGIRGRLSKDDHDVLTPRQNPFEEHQGKPGQALIWPGEFVFGYEGQNGKSAWFPGPVKYAGPGWARNGSFLVFRRLSQDVGTFHEFLSKQAKVLGLSPDELGAKLVGRWRSGAPILRSRGSDNPELADNDCANNHFKFRKRGRHIERLKKNASPSHCVDTKFPVGEEDKNGEILPLAGHTRKAYPRDDESDDKRSPVRERLNEADVQTHRLLRRGIPFGEQSASTLQSPWRDDLDKSLDRGLHFLAYMTSIEDQFEFVIKSWVNNPDFKEPGAGHDPIIGQSKAKSRLRKFKVTLEKGGKPATAELKTRKDWVIPTGGGYFFAPSLSALKEIAT